MIAPASALSPVSKTQSLSIHQWLYLLLCLSVGMYGGLGRASSQWTDALPDIVLWGATGLSVGCLALWLERHLTECHRSTLIGGSLGLIVALAGIGFALIMGMGTGLLEMSSLTPWIGLPVFLFCPYIGLMVGIHISNMLSLTPKADLPKEAFPHDSLIPSNTVQKLLDSSAIIDGRILPLCTTGFLEGPFLVPKSILHELQTLADSAHPSKRIKGKRGLDILSQMQELPNMDVMIIEDWEPDISAVDHQLIAIAKNRGAKIVTNDWNLAKVASVQGVLSLNVNELTYQLRPLVLPGETIRVFIHKEGQGQEQGIAHLDDGTMVVVDHGATLVGQAVVVVVTRFMQTNTGRMIFSTPQSKNSSLFVNLQSPLKVASGYSRSLVEGHG
ncbi:PIN/TRAM domain-containing protein [Nitrospira sp. T9]|uniref:PIN/TRAM domain-containing protein n=1 Tax=unclassified Nitrospira TaxID=2652172 RepID=UPI003F984C35